MGRDLINIRGEFEKGLKWDLEHQWIRMRLSLFAMNLPPERAVFSATVTISCNYSRYIQFDLTESSKF